MVAGGGIHQLGRDAHLVGFLAHASRSRNGWPDTRTRKPPDFTTGATMTSAWVKSRGSGYDPSVFGTPAQVLAKALGLVGTTGIGLFIDKNIDSSVKVC